DRTPEGCHGPCRNAGYHGGLQLPRGEIPSWLYPICHPGARSDVCRGPLLEPDRPGGRRGTRPGAGIQCARREPASQDPAIGRGDGAGSGRTAQKVLCQQTKGEPIKKPRTRRGHTQNQNKILLSDYLYPGGDHSLSSFLLLVFHFVAFVEIYPVQGRYMNEDVFSRVVVGNEPKALGPIKKFYSTSHYNKEFVNILNYGFLFF